MTEMQALQEMKFQPKDFEFAHESQELEKDEVMPARSAWKDSVSLFVRNKGAVIGIVCIALITIFAIVAPMLSGWKYDAIDTSLQNIAPGAQHWFGTDNYGRDLWVRLWQGTRISLFVAVAAIFIDVVIGVTYGMISGYFGGKVDSVMQRIQEVINSIPTLVILTILLMVMKSSLFTIILALSFTEWIGMSRITRAQVLKTKEEEFVLASRTLGAGSFFIIFKEILPNIYS